ncbi:MAG: tyrosine-type recombinase/integrase, partial [Kiritimatiellae bacterium]|nr:tyrosine-type recombinase/integrase [Kiritimatiellia bacterium]
STPDATFHSLRHTFVSFSANAGVPLPVVSSIVGHTSTAMTRHYYHENEETLRRAVSSVPSLEEIRTGGTGTQSRCDVGSPKKTVAGIPVRLKRLDRYLVTGVISKDEYATQRARILAEL